VQALQNEDLVVYGDETFRTSLCYVSDVVDGLVRLMAATQDQFVANIGSDQDIPIVQVAEKVVQMTASNSHVRFEAPLLFMTPLGLPVITAAKDELGWIPVVTLERGLQMTVDYAKAERNRIGLG
jgi:UDP-glucuronate decarboxylase